MGTGNYFDNYMPIQILYNETVQMNVEIMEFESGA